MAVENRSTTLKVPAERREVSVTFPRHALRPNEDDLGKYRSSRRRCSPQNPWQNVRPVLQSFPESHRKIARHLLLLEDPRLAKPIQAAVSFHKGSENCRSCALVPCRNSFRSHRWETVRAPSTQHLSQYRSTWFQRSRSLPGRSPG